MQLDVKHFFPIREFRMNRKNLIEVLATCGQQGNANIHGQQRNSDMTFFIFNGEWDVSQ